MATESIWFATLAGDPAALEVATSLSGRDDVTFSQTDGNITLELLSFVRETEPTRVRDFAEEIVRVVNGLGRLYISEWMDIAFCRLFRREVDKPPTAFAFSNSIFLRPCFSEATGTHERRIDLVFATSGRNEQAAKLLRLLGSEDRSFRLLYVAYEVIENALGGEKNLSNSHLCSATDLKRFKRTANSNTLGDDGRHDTEDKPPQKPMDLQEARVFVSVLAKAWLASV